jgi:triosephosphate isomerase (TIM)
MAKKKYLVGNWKMNPDTPEIAKAIFQGVKKSLKKVSKNATGVKVIVCPPFLYVQSLVKLAEKSGISIGAQDVFQKEAGSFTGEVSATMLKMSGAQYVIIGHSERRNLGEDSEMIRQKVKLALAEGLSVVLCVGEKTRDTHGAYLEVVKSQIKDVLGGIDSKVLSKVIIAYEPVWAIGAKEAMNPSQIHEMAIYVKKALREMYDEATVRAVKVLYGGSVTTANTESIVRDGEVDGLLIGRQSLDPKEFSEIISIANEM